jgi:1-acyl-sn-glycerol-3-phosphate acyltransferase
MVMLRRIVKLLAISLWLPVTGFFSFFVHIGGWGAIKRVTYCSRVWGRGFIHILNVKITINGDPDSFKGGLIVSNHMGYLDILVHGSIFPIRFTPKIDIRYWPILGWYLGISRPLWIDRSSKQKSIDAFEQILATMKHGIPLLVYPEGTSTDGENGIKTFKSTPFEAVAASDFPILPVVTYYEPMEDGLPVAWFGDMTLMPHLWRILGYKSINVEVHILPQVKCEGRSRKELAAYVHDLMEKEYWNIKQRQQEKAKVQDAALALN